MRKIGITGSIASGKTTASKILSYKRGPLFSADEVVKKLYKNNNFKKLLIREFNLKKKTSLKKSLKNEIFKNKKNLKKLEKIVHPAVRNEMEKFFFLHKRKKKTFCEIPLLVESKLTKYFDVVVFIRAKKKMRLKRFVSRGGNKKLFAMLNNRQLSDQKKIKVCDHIVDNEKNLNILKKNLLSIIKLYA